MTFAIYARPISNAEAQPQKLAEYATYDEALNGATEKHVEELWSFYDKVADNAQLYEIWVNKGTEFTIQPDDEPIKFSVWDCGPLFIMDITGDTSKPALFEITCTDALAFASGGLSPSKKWTFYAKAPASYARSHQLLERAVAMIYGDMTATSHDADGSSYVLQRCDIRPIDKEEFTQGITQPNRTIYAVQNNGTLAKEPHFLSV
ncbi:MAG: hypothetical protein SGJ27_30435 [Candidatus Melainabacteria bacterium]|nr:hypothetical protein [Candidatus Melainabacteria bacterium]